MTLKESSTQIDSTKFDLDLNVAFLMNPTDLACLQSGTYIACTCVLLTFQVRKFFSLLSKAKWRYIMKMQHVGMALWVKVVRKRKLSLNNYVSLTKAVPNKLCYVVIL